MITVRKGDERGHFDHGWLNTYHTFSFADYHDPRHVHFRTLRVINEDFVAPGRGFPLHPHRDMEILTYVLDGEIAHKDSMGNGSTIRAGEVQRMTAGTGVLHSEANSSSADTLHLLQIWIFPATKGLQPGYEQKSYAHEDKAGRLKLIASPEPQDGAVLIHQDASLYASVLRAGETVEHKFREKRGGWLQVARGEVTVNGIRLAAGDGAGMEGEQRALIEGGAEESELLLFDLA